MLLTLDAEGMMPIVTKKRHVDQETGRMVEGLSTPPICSPLFRTSILRYLMLSDWDLVFADDERESSPTSFQVYTNGTCVEAGPKGCRCCNRETGFNDQVD